MSKLEFRLATRAEDGALRAILRQNPMPGNVSLAFAREPSYFTAERAGSIGFQSPVCVERTSGEIVGVGGRSFRRMFVDGEEKTVGYLSNLRGSEKVRNTTILARAYRYLHELHGDGAVPYYVSTILNENAHAKRILESGRAGLPVYSPVATLVTYALPLRKKVGATLENVDRCSPGDLSQALECLRDWSRHYQFSPAYGSEDLSGGRMLPDFRTDDLFVYKRGGRIVGTLGVWDQSFKQVIVTGYSRLLSISRVLYNSVAWLKGVPSLPRVGENIRYVYATLVSSEDNDEDVFEALVQAARSQWSGRGYDYLLVGFCQGNPLTRVAERYATLQITSTAYLVYWDEDRALLPKTRRTAHLEIATL